MTHSQINQHKCLGILFLLIIIAVSIVCVPVLYKRSVDEKAYSLRTCICDLSRRDSMKETAILSCRQDYESSNDLLQKIGVWGTWHGVDCSDEDIDNYLGKPNEVTDGNSSQA